METVNKNQISHQSHKDKYFKGQQANEVLICFLRHHWIYLLKEFLYLAIFGLVVFSTLLNLDAIQGLLQSNREAKMLFITGFFLITFFMHRFFIKLLNYFINVGIITDIRFIDHQKTLFFKDTIDSVDLTQIQNIEMIENGLLPNIFGYGDLKIFLSATAAEKTYLCIPNIKFHYRCLSRLKEARRSMFMERSGISIHEIAGEENAKIFHQQTNEMVQSAKKPIPFEDRSAANFK